MRELETTTRETTTLPRDWARLRFTASVSLYGAALGAALVNVSLLSQQTELVGDPERLSLGLSLVYGTAGALAGLTITAPFAFWTFGARPTFATTRARRPRTFLVWLALGLGYGIAFPLALGAFFLPASANFLDFFEGMMSLPSMLVRSLDLVTGRAAAFVFVFGIRFMFTGLAGGAVFGVGGWIIDRFSTSADPTTARYGAWAITLVLSALVIITAAFAPELALAKLG
jgi:hypothetical protein